MPSMLNGPSRRLRAYLLMERVMMEADGEADGDDSFGADLTDHDAPLPWLWERLAPEEKAWCMARTREQIEASLAMPIGTPGFYDLDLSGSQSVSSFLAQHQIDPSDVHAEIGKLLGKKE